MTSTPHPLPTKKAHFSRTRKFFIDLFTGPDGETWAIGRIFSVPVLIVGLAIPIMSLLRDHEIAMTEVGLLLTGIASACLLLIRGNNNVDIDAAHLADLTKKGLPKL